MQSDGRIINGKHCFFDKEFMYNGDGESHYIVAKFNIKKKKKKAKINGRLSK